MHDLSRLRLPRVALLLAVTVLVAGVPAVPFGERMRIAAAFLVLASFGLAASERLAPRLRHGTWLLALALETTAHVVVVVQMSGAGRPFLLLLALPVFVWGLLRGLPGGLFAAALTMLAPLSAAIPAMQGAGAWLAPEAISGLSAALALFLLGLCSGFLGRRIHREEQVHRETQRELEETRLDAESIVACLSTGLLCFDASGRIRRVNGRIANILGGRPGLASGGDLETLGADPFLRPLVDHLRESLQWRWETTAELELREGDSPEEPLPLEVTTAPMLASDGSVHGLVVLLSDLTERRGRDREEKRKEKLAWIGQLSAGLAHEIRNSLKPITGSVELLRDELESGDLASSAENLARSTATRAHLMEIILQEAEALESFLTEFLGFARDKRLKLEPHSLETMIEGERATLEALIDRPIVFRLRDAETLPVRVDASALRQVLRNLVLNAAEAGAGELELEVARDGRLGVITLRDHGEGVPDDVRERVFDPFFTTKPRGTGLGLSIARDLVDRHGGSIRLEPAEGGGTRARVRLPLAA